MANPVSTSLARASSVAGTSRPSGPLDWLNRPWEDEQQVRMRLRPLEIKVSVNYARLSVNIVRLANTLKLRRLGAWDRCTAGFQSRLCPVRVLVAQKRFGAVQSWLPTGWRASSSALIGFWRHS